MVKILPGVGGLSVCPDVVNDYNLLLLAVEFTLRNCLAMFLSLIVVTYIRTENIARYFMTYNLGPSLRLPLCLECYNGR